MNHYLLTNYLGRGAGMMMRVPVALVALTLCLVAATVAFPFYLWKLLNEVRSGLF